MIRLLLYLIALIILAAFIWGLIREFYIAKRNKSNKRKKPGKWDKIIDSLK